MTVDTAPRTASAPPRATGEPLLRIHDLAVSYGGDRVLDGVELAVGPGELLGVIGETGSGKTTLARAVVGLAPVVAGRITVASEDRTALRGAALRRARRAGTVQYMFQDPLRSLDPDLTVRQLIGEPLAVSAAGRVGKVGLGGRGGRGGRDERASAGARVLDALDQVGLDRALADRTPGRLSGGQRQRVALARAIVTRPRLLIADEPAGALDASNRNHVLRLLDRLRRDLDLAVVVISHDLDSLAAVADRIAVLYRGRLVEQGPAEAVLTTPAHPYSALLAASAPSPGRSHRAELAVLRAPAERPPGASGCAFAHRCPFADQDCAPRPAARPYGEDRTVACHHAPVWRRRLGR